VETRSRLWRAPLALLAASLLAGVTIPTMPALAGPSCAEGTVCLWTGTDFEGDRLIVNPTSECVNLSAPVSSAVNASDSNVVLYSNSGCSEPVADLGPGEAVPAFSSVNSLSFS
jgi:hypothetical protein